MKANLHRVACLIGVACLLVGCVRSPTFVSERRYPPRDDQAPVQVIFAADAPAPAQPRLAFWSRPIHEGDQGAITKAVQDGKETARTIGADTIRLAISAPDARRQVVTIDFYRITP